MVFFLTNLFTATIDITLYPIHILQLLVVPSKFICLSPELCNPRFLFFAGQIPTLMQQLVILLDEPFQRLLRSGLRLQEVALLVPGLPG